MNSISKTSLQNIVLVAHVNLHNINFTSENLSPSSKIFESEFYFINKILMISNNEMACISKTSLQNIVLVAHVNLHNINLNSENLSPSSKI